MDCIGCDKCRLWGKVQTTGVATALKVLFEMDEKALHHNTNQNLLQRSEVVALINTLHRFSESLHAVEHFRGMWKKTGEADSTRLLHKAERAVGGNTPPVQSSPSPTQPLTSNVLHHAWSRLQVHLYDLTDRCRRHTLACFDVLSEIWQKLSNAILPQRTEL